MFIAAGYTGLFVSALLAATILPMQSEAVLVGLLLAKQHPAGVLLGVATAGNVLGSVINWGLGRYIEHWQGRRWFPVTPQRMERMQKAYRRYGRWSLLLSWVPVIGDPLTVAAGVLREPFWSFLLIVGLAKFGRYLVLYGLTLGWS